MHVPNVVTLECNLMCNNEDIEFIQIREMSQKVCWMKNVIRLVRDDDTRNNTRIILRGNLIFTSSKMK